MLSRDFDVVLPAGRPPLTPGTQEMILRLIHAALATLAEAGRDGTEGRRMRNLNLWQPAAHLSPDLALLTALALGVLHGITPDEHTWPITFSYAIGSYSTRRGLVAGLVFSGAFTLQRALASELAYLALARWMQLPLVQGIVYLVAGCAMAIAGWHILRSGRTHAAPHEPEPMPPRVPLPLAALHGFIAGWGFGAFAAVLYTVLAPAMPSAALAWAPGLCFGLGTLAVQAGAGALFGRWSRRRGLSETAGRTIAARVAGRTLGYGGLAFAGAGALVLFAPRWARRSVVTPLRIHNLHHLGIGFILAVGVVAGIGLVSLWSETRRAVRQSPRASPSGSDD